MSVVKRFCAVAVAVAFAPMVQAQEAPKPGPEHEVLKKLVGDWTLTMKFGDMESKGTVTYKMDLGGLWLSSTMESELFGAKFSGRGMDGYNAATKKYVGVWIDNTSAGPMLMEGSYDKEKKTMTMTGTGPGMDGKPTTHKTVSTMPDDDTINFSMYSGDAKEPSFTVVYKRKK